MKKLIALSVLFSSLLSCDPVAQMEATIQNSTRQNLSVTFISSEASLNKTLAIASGQTVLFQEGFDVGNTYLEPSLVEYDSVVLRSQEDVILRVYKANDTGKTLYGIANYWSASEPSKRFFKYNYQIEESEFE